MGKIGRILIPITFGAFLPYLCILFFIADWLKSEFMNSNWVWVPIVKLGAIFLLPLIFIISGVGFIFKSGALFLQQFHDLGDEVNASRVVRMRVFGQPLVPPPLNKIIKFDEIKIKKLSMDPVNHWATIIGGPVKIRIEKGHAAYIENLGHFSRVIGQGESFLHWNERIAAVTDVGPRTEEFEISAWTLDGIKVILQVSAEFFLGKRARSEGEEDILIPFDPESVRKAVEHTMMNGKETKEWAGTAKGQTIGIVSAFISAHYLDTLFLRENGNSTLFSISAITELVNKVNEKTQKYGVCLSSLQIKGVNVPPKVKEQLRSTLKAGHENMVIVNDSEVKAHQFRLQEKARAEMQRDLILTIANGLSRIDGEDFPEHLLLSVSSMLDQNIKDPEVRESLGKGALEILEKLQETIKFPLEMPGDEE